MHSSLWTLLAAEKQYEILVTCVTEHRWDKDTMEWIVSTIANWPRDVCSSPQMLQQFMWHLMSHFNLDTHVVMLRAAAELNAKLELLQAQKRVLAIRMIKKMQKGIKQLEDMTKKRKRRLRRGR